LPIEEINTGVQGFQMATLPATTHAGGRGLKSTTQSPPGAEDKNHSWYTYIPPPPSLDGLHTDRFTFTLKIYDNFSIHKIVCNI
jgi:hypothetical protein